LNRVETPCRLICVVDPLTAWCIGCGRARDEVATWSKLSEAERAAITAALPDRLQHMTARATRGRRQRDAAR
jgi:uncharacterized protein